MYTWMEEKERGSSMISSPSHTKAVGHFGLGMVFSNSQIPVAIPQGSAPELPESRSWDDGQLSSWTTYNEASRQFGTQVKPRPLTSFSWVRSGLQTRRRDLGGLDGPAARIPTYHYHSQSAGPDCFRQAGWPCSQITDKGRLQYSTCTPTWSGTFLPSRARWASENDAVGPSFWLAPRDTPAVRA